MSRTHWRSMVALLGMLGTSAVHAQSFTFDPARLWDEAAEPSFVDLPALNASDDSIRRARGPRLFRIPSPSLDDNAGQETGGNGFGGDPDDTGDDGDGRFQLFIGADNPYLDFRRRGDAGGVGFQRYSTQFSLANDGSTSVYFNMKAVVPASEETYGMTQGHSVVFPSLCCSHDLGDGSGLVGFVGKPARASVESFESINQNVHYGVAYHQPLLPPAPSGGQQVFLFVEALGRYRIASDLGAAPPGGWELVPGIHWQSNERCWLSGGMLFPFGSQRPESSIWQITCSWRF